MRVHDSQAYRKMDVTRERISRGPTVGVDLQPEVVALSEEDSPISS